MCFFVHISKDELRVMGVVAAMTSLQLLLLLLWLLLLTLLTEHRLNEMRQQ
jgi:hypothetical protein